MSVGGINIDECRVGSEEIKGGTMPDLNQKNGQQGIYNGTKIGAERLEYKSHNGRFPANTILDGSDEVVSGFPGDNDIDDSASRFFYTAKASKKDRNEGLEHLPKQKTEYEDTSRTNKKTADKFGCERKSMQQNIHPTVKPTDLMQYLIRLISPKGSTILDPFMGSGSTGKACMIENNERNADYHFIGIDLEEGYCGIAKARIEYGINYKENKAKEEASKIIEEGQVSIFDY